MKSGSNHNSTIVRNRRNEARIGGAVLTVLLFLGMLLTVVPLLWTVSSSLKPVSEIFSYPPSLIPDNPTFANYRRLFTKVLFLRWFWNSLLVSVITTALSLFFSTLGGFAFAKYQFRGKHFLFNVVLASMLIPFATILVPLFVLVTRAGMADSLVALVLPWMAPAYGIFLMRQFIVQSVPDELLHAARVDGASEFRLFRDQVLPIVRPALGALAIWNFLGVYNSFLWPLVVLSSNTKLTLPVGLAAVYGNYSREYGMVMAGAVLAAVPMIVLFVALRKQFIAGLTFGALKG